MLAIIPALILSSTPAIADPQPISASAAEIIGQKPLFQGDANAKTTLVVWIDYQCNACRKAPEKIRAMLARHPNGLRITYRNFPLPYHQFAFKAALTLEAARRQGAYWEAYRYLLASTLSDSLAAQTARYCNLDAGRLKKDMAGSAEAAVRTDLELAHRVGLSATPTWLLCKTDGSVVSLSNERLTEEVDAALK